MSRVRSPIAAMEGRTLRRLRIDEWPNAMFMARTPPFEVWLSRDFLVQLFHDNGSDRLSVCRTTIDTATRHWVDGISWDELQALKCQCGRADRWAVEVFPPDDRVVNVANMRHLWLLPDEPSFGWNDETQLPATKET